MPDASYWLTILLVTTIVTAGSAVQAAIGVGLNQFAIPILLLIAPAYAPGPVLVASAFLSILALLRVPAEVDRRELTFSLSGLVAGTAAAAIFIAFVDTRYFVQLMGFIIVLAVGLIVSGLSLQITSRNLFAAGSAAGLMGTIAGMHAPPIALLYQGQPPERVRGSLLAFVIAGNLLSITALWSVNRFGLAELYAALGLLPGVALGLLLAPLLVKHIDANRIRTAILLTSGLSGSVLLFGL